MRRAVINVTGRVQGVFFRHSARIHAAEFGLTGWARNEENGSVTITAEGEGIALEQFIAWCRNGPPLAKVDDLGVSWAEATGEFKKFEIL